MSWKDWEQSPPEAQVALDGALELLSEYPRHPGCRWAWQCMGEYAKPPLLCWPGEAEPGVSWLDLAAARGDTLRTPNRRYLPELDMVFVWVEGGLCHFSGARAINHKGPRREVRLSRGFWMGQFPVTNGQYQRVAAVELPDSLKAPTFEAEDQPAAGLSWKMAHQWCEKASKQTGLKIRLPTEVEWERTARGKDERRYPWGQTELSRERALYWSSGPTGRIGERPLGASPWGAQELLGNVWEWCEDFSGVVPDKNLVDWVQRTPSAGWRAERVLRGGAWLTRESSVNACYCGHRPPESRDLCLGFRVVLTK